MKQIDDEQTSVHCDTELDLECKDGKWPRLFKGSACEDINDGNIFPTFKELMEQNNPCSEAVSSFIIYLNYYLIDYNH